MYSNSDSDDGGQGFQAQVPLVESLITYAIKDSITIENIRPQDYEPRYICSDGMLKKQMIEISQKILEYPVKREKQIINQRTKKYKKPQHLPSCYQLYFQSLKYKLVYKRNKKIEQQKLFNDDFGRNINVYSDRQIRLTNLCSYNLSDYSILKGYKQQILEDSTHLFFDSKFQCGNLSCAFQNTQDPNQYDLFMQNDTNTHGYTQWFYFSIKGMKKGSKYRFNIVNYRKKHSFFKNKMLPSMFSFQRNIKNGIGWTREGSSIYYQKSDFSFKKNDFSDYAYTLSFQITIQHDNDIILLSPVPPYSYSRLITFLKQIEQKYSNKENLIYKIIPFYNTISNNTVPLVQIQSSVSQILQKRIIMIVSRQHPGQIWPSYIIQQLLEIIPNQQKLLEKYKFIIIPMINVDGVIYGNFRCDISGDDLNRQWNQPSKQIHPHIYKIKQLIQSLSDKIDIFLDLHGHSKKLNTFSYCCKLGDQFNCRHLPLILNKLNNGFKIQDCTYGIDKSKANTLRAFGFRQTSKVNVMTMQCSLYGLTTPSGVQHYQPKHMKDFAFNIIDAMRIMLVEQNVYGLTLELIQKQVKNRISQFILYDHQNENDSGSDSDPYIDQLTYLEKIKRIFPKNLQIPKSTQRIKKTSRKSLRKSKQKNKTTLKIEEDLFNMNINLRKTLNVATPKEPQKKQNSFKDLILNNTSKKQINVFIPRVAFLDISSNRKIKQQSLFKNLESMIGPESVSYNRRTRPLIPVSKVSMAQSTVPTQPVSSLLLNSIVDSSHRVRRKSTCSWIRQPYRNESRHNTFHRIISRSKTKSQRGIKSNYRYSEDK